MLQTRDSTFLSRDLPAASKESTACCCAHSERSPPPHICTKGWPTNGIFASMIGRANRHVIRLSLEARRWLAHAQESTGSTFIQTWPHTMPFLTWPREDSMGCSALTDSTDFRPFRFTRASARQLHSVAHARPVERHSTRSDDCRMKWNARIPPCRLELVSNLDFL